MIVSIVAYALLWLSFGVLHSVLAADSAKQRLKAITGARYRLAYNVVAIIHTALVLILGVWFFRDFPAFELGGAVRFLLASCFVLGVIIGLLALREYDLGLFTGLSAANMSSEPLCTDGLHRYVRHPLYTGLFLILFGIAGSAFGLATALFGCLYLILGTVFEERKLVDLYGDEYRNYQLLVPAFVPWRGRVMLPDR